MYQNIIKQKFLALVLTIAALVAGQGAWATTKTVTYRITDFSLDSGGSGYNFVFTRQGDTPFETSAPTTYTGYVNKNSIGQNPGNGGHISLQLADGFELSLSWGAGSDIKFMSNCIYPNASNKYITYSVSCSNDNYYVTHVMMTGYNSNYQQGLLQPYPHNNESIDYDYSSEWHFHNSYLSAYAFGQITITYTDVPLLSIFESDGENAYKIKDKYDLRHLAAYVNNGGNNCSGLTFRQTQAITCDATYVPIGYRFSSSNRSYFKGTYDGQGHTVSGITVTRTGDSGADGCIGLFGYVEYGGTVQNVVLASSTFTGNDYMGGIVGLNWSGTVKNCRVESSVTIKAGCDNAWNHGGIVGYNDSGTIEGCVSAASILNNGKSTHQFCGGITGRTSKPIRDCLYTGTTIEADAYKGAICGYSDSGATYANNYYTTINLGGVGSTSSSSDQNGARRARTVTLGTNVALVGNETTYSVSGLTAIGTSALRYNNTLYSGATQTLNLRYSGEALATGYAAIYSVDGTRIARSTFEVPAGDVSVSVAATDVWGVSGTPAADGSADHPYTISSTYSLDLLAKNVNGSDGYTAADFSGQHFLQTAPITYDGTENNYTPIGNSSHYFKGHYDGGGETISGININSSDNYKGLFGEIGSGAEVKNVVLADAQITGAVCTGGIAGRDDGGTISGCVVEDDVTIGYAAGNVTCHGGIVGNIINGGVVSGCVSKATINGSNSYNNGSELFGGIAGQNNGGSIRDCLYTGSTVQGKQYIGAIVGNNISDGTLTNNYYTNIDLGAVNGNDTDGARRARTVTLGEHVALVGSQTAYNVSGLTFYGTTALSYNDGNATTNYSCEGQTVSLAYTGDVMPTGYTAVFSVNGTPLERNIFTMPANDVSVTFVSTDVWGVTNTPAADGSAEHPYLIGSTHALDLLAKNVNASEGYTANTFQNKYFLQTADITYDGTENNYTPIGNSSHDFKGHYDGNGNTVSGISISRSTATDNGGGYLGLFGWVNSNGTVQKVILANSTFTGADCIGGIAGFNQGTVQNCRVESTVTIKAGRNGTLKHGGIVGYMFGNYSKVIGCVSAASIQNNGLTGHQWCGGIVGQNSANSIIENCLYIGTTIQAHQYKGAIVGNNSGTFTNNYYTNINLGGVAGSERDGARLARTVTLGENIALVGDETAYEIQNHSCLTAIGSTVLRYYDGNSTTLYSGEGQTLTLNYTGDIVSGTKVAYSYNDGSDHIFGDNSFAMPAANVTVSYVPVYPLTFNNGVTTPTVPALIDNGIGFYPAGTAISLDYIIPSGYVFNRFTSTAGSIHNGNILTMAAQDATVSVYKSAKWGINNENDGSETKPYIISSDDELNLLSDCVNGTTGYAHYDANDFTGKYFKVDGFIPYSEKLYNNFITIGTNGKEFNGTFDGNNKVIKSIRITDSSASHQGLFGHIGTSGTVKNVLLEDAVIINPSATSTVGVIAAHNEGTLTDNYYFSCKINIDSLNIGTSGGDVNINDGAVSMHIVTPGEGVIVTGSKHFYINDSPSSFDTGDNYYPRGSTITLSPAEGYLVGSGYTATKEKFKSNNPDLDPGSEENVPVTENAGVYSFTVPAGRVTIDNLVPDIATYWHADDDHDGTSEERAYIISNTTGLNILASHVNYGDDCSGVFFRQGNDIAYDPAAVDANGINFAGIGGDFHLYCGVFSGTFDGCGHTISGIRINRTMDNVGLFGNVWNGTVKNVILVDAQISGGNFSAALVGTNAGTLKNCIVVGSTVTKRERYNFGIITGMESGDISNNYYYDCSIGGEDYGIGIGNSEYSSDENYNDGAIQVNAFPLLCTGINDHVLANNYNIADKSFTIAGRTLYEDGDWNTLCLPFSLSAEQIAAHERFAGADIRALSSASVNDGTLTLNFTAKGAVTSIQAGVPYIVRWDRNPEYEDMPSAYDIKDATFTGVTITSTTPGAVTSAGGKVTFQGTYDFTQYTDEDRSVLFLGTQNHLYYSPARSRESRRAVR